MIPTGVAGPLPEGIVGLVLGGSSLSLQGIYGVVDSDYTEETEVWISPPIKTVQINKGQRITAFAFTLLSDRKNLDFSS